MAGRPAFKPTPTQRRKVAAAAGAGMAQEQIAAALGITKPTLAKHFELELTAGAALKKLEVLDALHLQAKKGNVAAIKAYLAISVTPPREGDPDGQAASPPAPGPQPKTPRLGKKEVQQLNAAGAEDGTDWAGLLPSGAQVQ